MSLQFRQIAPAPDLGNHVRHYWILEGEVSAEPAHPVFPDGCGEIVFNLGPVTYELHESGGSSAQPAAMLVGQMTRPVHLLVGGALRMVGIKLAPWGAAAILGEVGATVRDRTVALSELRPRALEHVAEQLDQCGNGDEIGAILDHAVRAGLGSGAGPRLERLESLTRWLCHEPGSSVDLWSSALGCSVRTLERHFGRYIGLSPKEFSRVRRFQRALRLARSRPSLRWATIAARTGYSDQAHLVRDFRQFAGSAPTLVGPASTPITTAFVEPADEAER